jgi:hypothetical protein
LIIIIFLGIISRKINFIPLCLGDFLYAVMIFLLIRIFLINHKLIQIAVISILICYSIELFQLYQSDWIIAARKTLFGKYLLGQGFLWSDLVAYTFGITCSIITDHYFKNDKNETRLRIKQQE